ncbi:ABC transporter permease [Microbacterium trichothecenolyticum]|uniref:ABC transporter permease n=1 Tax=Microbacterium ureisolvens TaxID=2781186 RepID=A0ABS7HWN4_9MICO|nr:MULTISPECIES: ABC transporter permease [Microbacterium]MBW9108962.1 ABC transporter permease [Microbacterium ureisolvens]MBW9119914.1 ABC transporter permease [Microbacterium trichothecenolyticum]
MSVSPRLDSGPRLGRGLAVLGARHRGTPALVGRRLLQIPAVLFVVSVLVFWLIQIVPGDPGRNALGPYASAEQVAEWNAARGLDGSVIERYLSWIGGFFVGQWGTSIVYGESVRELILERLGNSVALGVFAFLILVPLAIGIGVVQARREGSRTDRAFTVGLMSLASVPEFVMGVVLLIVFGLIFPILPIQSGDAVGAGFLPQLRAMTLPALTLAFGYLSVLARMTRSGVIETTGSQFYRTAVIKGLRGGDLFRRHVARNALIPTISLLGVYLGALLGGSAVVETLFGYPGLGELLVTATQKKDVFVLVAGVMVTGLISLIALLVTDLVFTIVDPRVRFTGKG